MHHMDADDMRSDIVLVGMSKTASKTILSNGRTTVQTKIPNYSYSVYHIQRERGTPVSA